LRPDFRNPISDSDFDHERIDSQVENESQPLVDVPDNPPLCDMILTEFPGGP